MVTTTRETYASLVGHSCSAVSHDREETVVDGRSIHAMSSGIRPNLRKTPPDLALYCDFTLQTCTVLFTNHHRMRNRRTDSWRESYITLTPESDDHCCSVCLCSIYQSSSLHLSALSCTPSLSQPASCRSGRTSQQKHPRRNAGCAACATLSHPIISAETLR